VDEEAHRTMILGERLLHRWLDDEDKVILVEGLDVGVFLPCGPLAVQARYRLVAAEVEDR
jgi:hypothetical protein